MKIDHEADSPSGTSVVEPDGVPDGVQRTVTEAGAAGTPPRRGSPARCSTPRTVTGRLGEGGRTGHVWRWRSSPSWCAGWRSKRARTPSMRSPSFSSPPPNGVSWLVTTAWWGGTAGVIAVLAVLALFTRRWQVIRDVLFSATAAFVLSVGLRALVGADGGRPPDPSLKGIDLGFPVIWVAVTTAVVLAMLPYVSRWLQLSSKAALALASVAGIVHGAGMPVAILAGVAIGWGSTAAIRLIFGSPVGLPSVAEVMALLADLDIVASAIAPSARQEWGVGRFHRAVGFRHARRLDLRTRRLGRAAPGEDFPLPPLPRLGADPRADPPPAGRTRGPPHPDRAARRGPGVRRRGRRPGRAGQRCVAGDDPAARPSALQLHALPDCAA